MADHAAATALTGHCFCGEIEFRASRQPEIVTYCHCNDCRRVSGAPVSALAAFDESVVSFTPNRGKVVSKTPGSNRAFCSTCGSPVVAWYDYLPGQVYVPVGLIDEAEGLAPKLHAHESSRLPWLHMADDLERFEESSRSRLADAHNADIAHEGSSS